MAAAADAIVVAALVAAREAEGGEAVLRGLLARALSRGGGGGSGGGGLGRGDGDGGGDGGGGTDGRAVCTLGRAVLPALEGSWLLPPTPHPPGDPSRRSHARPLPGAALLEVLTSIHALASFESGRGFERASEAVDLAQRSLDAVGRSAPCRPALLAALARALLARGGAGDAGAAYGWMREAVAAGGGWAVGPCGGPSPSGGGLFLSLSWGLLLRAARSAWADGEDVRPPPPPPPPPRGDGDAPAPAEPAGRRRARRLFAASSALEAAGRLPPGPSTRAERACGAAIADLLALVAADDGPDGTGSALERRPGDSAAALLLALAYAQWAARLPSGSGLPPAARGVGGPSSAPSPGAAVADPSPALGHALDRRAAAADRCRAWHARYAWGRAVAAEGEEGWEAHRARGGERSRARRRAAAAEAAFNRARLAHERGDAAEACALYARVLRGGGSDSAGDDFRDPNDANDPPPPLAPSPLAGEAAHNWAMLRAAAGRADEARGVLRRFCTF